MSIVAIIGSNYSAAEIAGYQLQEEKLQTSFGELIFYRFPCKRPSYVIFRHGLPYCHLPHQIPYEAHAELLYELQCKALLLTSSVGVLDSDLPLFTPMLVSDFIMLDNRLPNGKTCTLSLPKQKQTHLVFQDGPFSSAMNTQIQKKINAEKFPLSEVIYAYFAGPRTKTQSENRFFALMGAQVNSMTMGPEIVLANELGIPTSALVVGHKYSLAAKQSLERMSLAESIVKSKRELENWIVWFFQHIDPPNFGNLLYQIN